MEWDSLLFFAGLFVFTEGISELGLLRVIADQLSALIESVPVGDRSLVSSVGPARCRPPHHPTYFVPSFLE